MWVGVNLPPIVSCGLLGRGGYTPCVCACVCVCVRVRKAIRGWEKFFKCFGRIDREHERVREKGENILSALLCVLLDVSL